MNDQDRENAYGALSHMEGVDGVEVQFDGFDGNGVENFGGSSRAFAQAKKFTLTIANNGSAAVNKILAILPAYFATAAQVKTKNGTASDAIVADGQFITAINANVTAAGAPGTVADFIGYINGAGHACRLLGILVKVDDAAQLDSDIYIKQNSPFNDVGDIIETPSNWKRSEEPNEKIAQLDFSDQNIILSSVTSILTTIQAGRKLTLTFNIAETFKASNLVKKTVAVQKAKKHKLAARFK